MIKFSGTNPETGHPLLGIGLSKENCDRLLEGQPIMFPAANMAGLPAIDVFIMGGTDESTMLSDMLKAGVVTMSQVHGNPSLDDPHSELRPAESRKVN